MNDWLVAGWLAGWMSRWIHRSINLGLFFPAFSVLGSIFFSSQNCYLLSDLQSNQATNKMLTWPALILSMYLTIDLETFILCKHQQPFSWPCGHAYALPWCWSRFPCIIIWATVEMHSSLSLEESDVTLTSKTLGRVCFLDFPRPSALVLNPQGKKTNAFSFSQSHQLTFQSTALCFSLHVLNN